MGSIRDKQTLGALWKWHQVALEIGKSENYRNRITEVARDLVKGEPLSNRAKAAMQHDLQVHKQQQIQLNSHRQSRSLERE
jgi:hypothetical protein